MQSAQIPSQGDIVIEEFETAPGVAGGGSIDQCEQNAGDHLKHQNHRGRAAKDIPPARGAGRDLMLGCFDCGRAQPEPVLEPVVDIGGAFFQTGHESAPGFESTDDLSFSASASIVLELA